MRSAAWLGFVVFGFSCARIVGVPEGFVEDGDGSGGTTTAATSSVTTAITNTTTGTTSGGGEGGLGAGGMGGGGTGGGECELSQNQLIAHYVADASKVTLAANNAVLQWDDDTNAYPLVPWGDNPTSPTYVPVSSTGRPSIAFAGLSGMRAPEGEPDILLFTGSDVNIEATIVVVARVTALAQDNPLVSYGLSSANRQRLYVGSYPSTWAFEVTRGAETFCEECIEPSTCSMCDGVPAAVYSAIDPDLTDNWAVLVAAKGADFAYLTRNRKAATFVAGVIPPLGWYETELWVGGLGANVFTIGEIAEVALYGRAMPELEARADVATCLGEKYGIPLASL